jgi:hypothetical protein
MVAISISVQNLIDSTRVDADAENDPIVSDPQVAQFLSDGGSALYDRVTASNNYFNIAPFDFTLAGGIGGNTVALPANHVQGHGLELNPDTARPISIPYLANWLDRNRLAGIGALGGAGASGRQYTISGGNIVMFPPTAPGGHYRHYFTPAWVPFALTSSITVQTAAIPLFPNTTMGFDFGSVFQLDTGPDTFTTADVGNFIQVAGATNPDNNGAWTIESYVTAIRVGVGGSPISEAFPPEATVTLHRQSNVTADGTWTFFGADQFTQTTGNVHVGDTINVSGAVNAPNNGSFTVTAVVGLNTVVTADAVGLVAENLVTGTVTATVQPAGTTSKLPPQFNPWQEYLRLYASIAVLNKRGQSVAALTSRMKDAETRIISALTIRKEEPSQPPLTRSHLDGFDDFGFGF